MFGNFMVTLKYTDTEQARVPKYSAVLGWDQSFGSHNFNITYRGQFERIPGLYDGTELEDLQNLSFGYVKTFDNATTTHLAKVMQLKVYLIDVDERTGQITPDKVLDCIKKNKLKKRRHNKL